MTGRRAATQAKPVLWRIGEVAKLTGVTTRTLRYWEELTEAQVAQAMGCSPGTVKSVTSRGMRRLRELSGLGDNDGTPQRAGRTS